MCTYFLTNQERVEMWGIVLNKIHDIIFNGLLLLIIPLLFVFLFTKNIVLDFKNLVFSLTNKENEINAK